MIARRAAVCMAALIGLAGTACAQTRTVTGQAGVLGEWDLTATVTEQDEGAWAGPLVLKHTGYCGADGPEEKAGELTLHVSDPPGRLTATLLIEGTACSFEGRFKGTYGGVMTCPDRRGVPMMLSIE